MDECYPPSRMAIIRARGSTVARQCASHCRCRLLAPGVQPLFPATEQSRLPAAHPSSALEGCQEGRSALDHPLHWITRAKRPSAILGALAAMCLQQLGRECVAEAGRAAPAQRAAAQQSEPAPGGGRVYRALHSPCGPAAHIALALALPWCESTTRARTRVVLLFPFKPFRRAGGHGIRGLQPSYVEGFLAICVGIPCCMCRDSLPYV